jgi:hypothetical protein
MFDDLPTNVDLLDQGADGRDVFIEDGGFPNLVEGRLRPWTADDLRAWTGERRLVGATGFEPVTPAV